MTGIDPYVCRDGTVLAGEQSRPNPWAGRPETSARRQVVSPQGRGTTLTGQGLALRARRATVDRNWAGLSPEAWARLLDLDKRESRRLR